MSATVNGPLSNGTVQRRDCITASRAIVASLAMCFAARSAAHRVTDRSASSRTISFAPGQTVTTVPLVIEGDTLEEPDELVVVSLQYATNATIGGFYGLGVGTIRNDD